MKPTIITIDGKEATFLDGHWSCADSSAAELLYLLEEESARGNGYGHTALMETVEALKGRITLVQAGDEIESHLILAMTQTARRELWDSALAAHFDLEAAAHPVPAREQLSEAEEIQCQILGGTFLAWLKGAGPALLQEREALRKAFGVESRPKIVLISTVPGLVAAREILHPRPSSIFFFSSEGFASFLKQHPDHTFQWHVTYECFFCETPETEILTRASQKYKLSSSEQFWVHRELSTLADLFGRGANHLWKWNGKEPTLLEEGFDVWVS